MNINFNNIQDNNNLNLHTIPAQARYLMSQERQRVQQRKQAMHNRVVAELDIDV